MGNNKKQLDHDKLVNRIVRGGVNYLSGTVAPAKSDPDSGNIESLDMAFEHYRKRGVTDLIIQHKWMGSRCQLYLYKDIEKCYAVSRNGFVIKKDMECVVKKWHDTVFNSQYGDGISLIVLDGELLPWSFLGDRLIDENFVQYSKLVERELGFLKSNNFYGNVKDTMYIFEYSEKRKKDINNLLKVIDTNTLAEMQERFKDQLDLHARDTLEPYFMAFNILKVVRNGCESITVDNNELNAKTIDRLCGYNDATRPYIVIDLLNDGDRDYAHEFVNSASEDGYEGVVVKPSEYSISSDCAPMLKVRNPEYLRLVYGYDYTTPDKLKVLCERKRIGRKVGQSIKEYKIGYDLLKIDHRQLDKSNQHYRDLVDKALRQFSFTEELDPRL